MVSGFAEEPTHDSASPSQAHAGALKMFYFSVAASGLLFVASIFVRAGGASEPPAFLGPLIVGVAALAALAGSVMPDILARGRGARAPLTIGSLVAPKPTPDSFVSTVALIGIAYPDAIALIAATLQFMMGPSIWSVLTAGIAAFAFVRAYPSAERWQRWHEAAAHVVEDDHGPTQNGGT